MAAVHQIHTVQYYYFDWGRRLKPGSIPGDTVESHGIDGGVVGVIDLGRDGGRDGGIDKG
jgi:hypothetical protein